MERGVCIGRKELVLVAAFSGCLQAWEPGLVPQGWTASPNEPLCAWIC